MYILVGKCVAQKIVFCPENKLFWHIYDYFIYTMSDISTSGCIWCHKMHRHLSGKEKLKKRESQKWSKSI